MRKVKNLAFLLKLLQIQLLQCATLSAFHKVAALLKSGSQQKKGERMTCKAEFFPVVPLISFVG